MLSTPGRSPRHLPPLPSPSPSQKHGKSLTKPPVSKKKRLRDVAVLDEDSYVEAIEHIVQRDYFPDLPRLQDRLEWLEAIRTGDPEIIRQAQVKISRRRAQRSQHAGTPGSVRNTPATALRKTPGSVFGTPGGFSLAGSQRTPGGASLAGVAAEEEEEDEEEVAVKQERLKMSLDDFLLSHTSQDNASFKTLNENENKKRREKASHLFLLDAPNGGDVPIPAGNSTGTSKALVPAGTAASEASRDSTTDPDRKADGFGSSGQPTSTLDFWPYKAKNELMYGPANRDSAPLTNAEVIERSMGPPKQVKFSNTRFRKEDSQQDSGRQSVEDKVAILYDPIPGETPMRQFDPHGERGSRKHYDLEELRRTPRAAFEAALNEAAGSEAAKVQSVGLDGKPTSYEYVSTPVLNPGEGPDSSPFMTWGDIESTPLRLEAEDTPVGIGGSADGPHFSILKAGSRDEAAMGMSRVAAKSLKQKQRLKTGVESPGWGMSPAASRRGSLTPGMSPGGVGLSPAARKLVNSAAKTKGSAGFDATLRASYANSPMRTPSRLSTAKKSRTSGMGVSSPLV